ncbi:hypothetical protein AVEN_186721-1 [Araneus ventricosus]|uniref:Reverse transcriptase domain-containing protein n=1 Tax=Araneus ventricosus TaxID=182803 RepID=A0A4Y2QTQ1_ARAVE|nr:hypothetical protein AVEN_186721-1 [Araneus ventricosus]
MDKNQLQISSSKSAYILIGKLVRDPTIKWGTKSIKRCCTIKYLGIILDEKHNSAAHVEHQGTKIALTRKRIVRIAGVTWSLKQEYRRILYSTVVERMRMILHGAAAWQQNLSSGQKKLLLMIQRQFPIFINGAYHTTLKAALQSKTGILPFCLRAEQGAV